MSKLPNRILIVDDDEDVLLAASMLLKKHFQTVHTIQEPEKLFNMARNDNYDIILLDMNFTYDTTSGKEGFFWLKNIINLSPNTVVVLITAYGDVEMAVSAIKEGAFDFVLKPWQNEKLLSTVSAALQLRESKIEVNELKSQQKQLISNQNIQKNDFIGQSNVMKNIFATIRKVAATDANILITGENGTGKELVARAIYAQSLRKDKIFVSVDMGSLTDNLFESELFGVVKGAFTDAREDRQGRFEVANGGTLFLDEIGNIPIALQAKLLAVLQNRQVTRLGSSKPANIDIRLISATNNNLEEMVKNQQFRQDLLYRINTVEIKLPPLRERKEDIELLVEHYLNFYSKKYNKIFQKLRANTLNDLITYSWPGNIRELQHTIERAIILCDSDELLPNDFMLGNSKSISNSIFDLDNFKLNDIEKLTIERALKIHNGNITLAARELGLTRTSLYRRMEKYGI